MQFKSINLNTKFLKTGNFKRDQSKTKNSLQKTIFKHINLKYIIKVENS